MSLHQWLEQFAFPDVAQVLREHCGICGQLLASIRGRKLHYRHVHHKEHSHWSVIAAKDRGKYRQLVLLTASDQRCRTCRILWQARVTAYRRHDGPALHHETETFRSLLGREFDHRRGEGAEDRTHLDARQPRQKGGKGPSKPSSDATSSREEQELVTQMGRLLRSTDFARLQSDCLLVLTLRDDGPEECILPALLEVAAE